MSEFLTFSQLARRLDLDKRTLTKRINKAPQQTAGTIKGKPVYSEADLPTIRKNLVEDWKR